MKLRLLLALLPILGSSAAAQVNRDDLTPLDIAYTTTVLDTLKALRIHVDVNNIARPHTRVAMPNWTPGAYGIRRFGEQVGDLQANDPEGRPLEVTRLDHQTWSINTDGVKKLRVTYSVRHRRRRFGRLGNEPITGMHFQGPGTYVYVVGAKSQPVTSKYVLPEGWGLANGLIKTADPTIRRARDYDTFIDAPTTIGKFIEKKFAVNGTPFSCVFFANNQQYDFDIGAFVEICRKIVTCQGSIFGSYPFPNYVFLFNMGGGGGLEHLNSTSIGLSPGGMRRDVTVGASVTSHEFFHTWNVKRIRPVALGPFEYQHENYTGNLWVSEGWTSYYGDLTMARAGIISRGNFLAKIESALRRELNKQSRKKHSVYWASRNVWHRRPGEEPRVDYYAKGEILGALIDLKIRHETSNKKSLDDVMRFFNRWFAERNLGFEEGDVERACTAISNYDFSEFFARHVHGTLDPPLKQYLAYAGVEYTERRLASDFPFSYRKTRRGLRVGGRRGTTPASDSKPARGDVILAIDGKRNVEPAGFLEKSRPGQDVTLALVRGERELQISVKLIDKSVIIPRLRMMKSCSALQKTIRESWLTGN